MGFKYSQHKLQNRIISCCYISAFTETFSNRYTKNKAVSFVFYNSQLVLAAQSSN